MGKYIDKGIGIRLAASAFINNHFGRKVMFDGNSGIEFSEDHYPSECFSLTKDDEPEIITIKGGNVFRVNKDFIFVAYLVYFKIGVKGELIMNSEYEDGTKSWCCGLSEWMTFEELEKCESLGFLNPHISSETMIEVLMREGFISE